MAVGSWQKDKYRGQGHGFVINFLFQLRIQYLVNLNAYCLFNGNFLCFCDLFSFASEDFILKN